MSAGIEVLAKSSAVLGEGPAWEASAGRLHWVDILGGTVHATDFTSGETSTLASDEVVSVVVPATDGRLAVAARGGFGYLGADGTVDYSAPVALPPQYRCNDGKCDAQGRLWAGSMANDQHPDNGTLFRWAPGTDPVPVLAAVTVSNGLAWSPDGGTLYFIDTPKQRVDAYRVTADGLAEHRVHADLTGVPGVPDGMTIDDEGYLWVAMCFGGRLVRIDPSGAVAAHVELPVALPTSVCFVGPGLDRLAVTTATVTLSGSDLADQPLAGSVLLLDPGVTGAPTHPLANS